LAPVRPGQLQAKPQYQKNYGHPTSNVGIIQTEIAIGIEIENETELFDPDFDETKSHHMMAQNYLRSACPGQSCGGSIIKSQPPNGKAAA
jgi:hypothetical protein